MSAEDIPGFEDNEDFEDFEDFEDNKRVLFKFNGLRPHSANEENYRTRVDLYCNNRGGTWWKEIRRDIVYTAAQPIAISDMYPTGRLCAKKNNYRFGRDSTHSTTAFFRLSRAPSLGNTLGNAKKSWMASG